MYGNQLVRATSLWTAGYIVGQIPCNLALSRVSPRYVIPGVSRGSSHVENSIDPML